MRETFQHHLAMVMSERGGVAGGEDQAFLGLNIMRVQPSSQSFALCVEDGGMEDLEARKLYQILPDGEAAREGYIRVVDEWGKGYVYPSDLVRAHPTAGGCCATTQRSWSVQVSGRPRDGSTSPVSGSETRLRSPSGPPQSHPWLRRFLP